ncbi:MAG: HAMP domain-containing protein [Deltaproteobacteria bacterium]|nr:HAMP domain-containing protein [Deltaproteobacteria bacterium]
MMIKLNWPNRILLYSMMLTAVSVLLTAAITVRTASGLWEKEFLERNTAYAMYTSLEVLRTFGGAFNGTVTPQVAEAIDLLTVHNEDLLGVMILTESGRTLFSTLPDDLVRGLEGSWEAGLGAAVAGVVRSKKHLRNETSYHGRRLLDVLAPVNTQGGNRPIAVRYIYGYGSLETKTANLIKGVLLGALLLMGIGSFLSIFLSRSLTSPLKILSESAARIAGGDRNYRIDLQTGDEMENLAEQFNRMVDSLREQQEDLERANVELQNTNVRMKDLQAQLMRSERLAALGQLSAGVSHELDNPIGVILGYAELIKEESEGEKQSGEYAGVILDEAKRCKRIIAGLLDFSRPRLGEKGTVDLKGLIHGLTSQLSEQRAFRRINWRLTLGDGDALVHADPDALRQVIVNLCLNSSQAMGSDGEIAIDISPMRDRDRDGHLVRLADGGPGIDNAVIERVFDPFFTTKKRGEGTGLGLSICRKLIEEADGWIRAVKGKGGVFELWLPAVAASED